MQFWSPSTVAIVNGIVGAVYIVAGRGCEAVKMAERKIKKKLFSVCFLLLVSLGQTVALSAAAAETTIHFNIPRQQADGALTAFGQQADITVLYQYDLVEKFHTNQLQGEYSLSKAVSLLLVSTGLKAEFDRAGHLIITQDDNRVGEMTVNKKNTLYLGILAALSSFFGTSVQAATEEAVTGDQLEEVVVMGNRLINRNAISQKRETFQVKDSIGENEVGGLAASNAAELLAKVPGVNSFEDLSGRGSGGSTGPEPQLVSIRGIQPALNLVTLDGLSLAISAFEDRAQRMDVFPVNLSGRTDIMKTFTSGMDAGAVGGQIDFITRRGIDFAEPLITFTVETGIAEEDEAVQDADNPVRFEALYVGQLSETIGLAASASYNKREVGKPSQLTRGRSRSIDFPEADDVRVVREHRILSESAESERTGLSAKLDFAPDDDTYAWITTAYSKVDQTIHHAKTDVRIPSSATGLTLNPNGTSGILRIDDSGASFGTGRSAFSEVGEFVNESELTVFQAGYENRLSEDLTLLVKGGYSEASNSRDAEYYLFMREGGVTDVAFDGSDVESPQLGVISPEPASYFDPSNYGLLYRNLLPEVADEDLLDISPTLAFNAEPGDEGFGITIGLRYKKTDRKYDFGWTTRYDVANANVEGSGFTLADVYAENSASLSPPGANSAFPGFYADIKKINSQITPQLNDPAQFELESRDDRNLSSDYGIKETVKAAFFEGIYQADRFQTIFGLRFEQTKTDGTGFRKVADEFQPSSNSGSYNFVLPSMLVNYDLMEDVKLRFAVSQTLGRPAFPQIAPTGESISLGLQNTLERSNPDIDPRLSTNLDLAFEWYFKSDSLLSIGLFSKKIDDEILVETSTNVVIDGITFDEVTEPVNAASADLTGVELSLVTYFDFLPEPFADLGLSFNIILLDTGFDTEGKRGEVDFLLYQPDEITNLSLLYTNDDFDISISWNHTGDLPTVFNPSNENADRFIDGRTTVSAKFLYYVNEDMQVYMNGTNLTSEDSSEMTGEGFLYHKREMGRTINIGATYTF